MRKAIKTKYILWTLFFSAAMGIYAANETEVRTYNAKYVDVQILKMQIEPYLSPRGRIVVDEKNKTITVTDTPEAQESIGRVIREVDVAQNSPYTSNRSNPDFQENYTMETIRLENLPPDIAIRLLREIVNEGGSADNPGISLTGKVKFKEMRGLNSILVIANKEDMRVIKKIIQDLDSKKNNGANQNRMITRVLFLQNTNALEVAAILERMKSSGSQGGYRGGRSESSEQSFLNENSIISPVESNNSLVIMAAEKDMPEIVNLVHQIDKVPPQVLIEIIIFEVTLKNGQSFGAEFGLHKDKPSALTESVTDFGLRGKLEGDGQGYFFNYESEYLDALLSALEESGDVKILSAPQILVANNKEAEISIGDSVVISKETLEIPTSDVASPIVRTTRDYVDVGLRLVILPKINDDTVYMDILQEVNDIKESGIPGFPEIAKRTLETSIIVRDSESAVLGGLISRKNAENVSKVPLIGDFPVVGRLFRKTESEVKSTELILFVTAYVVTDQDQLLQLTEKQKKRLKSIRLRMLEEEK